MADSVKTFGFKMTALGGAYKGVGKAIAYSGAAVMKASTLASLRRVVPSGQLRNVGKYHVKVRSVKGGRLNVNYYIRDDVAFVKAVGPWQLIEEDISKHDIRPNTKKAVSTPYGPRALVGHPGTHGRHPWRSGVTVGKVEVRKVAQREASAPIKAIF